MLSLLGIARRAGRLAVGTHAVTMAAKAGRLGVLVVASDASDNAISRLGSAARDVPRITAGDRAELGRAVGRNEVAVAGVTDAALAKKIVEENQR